MNYREEVARTGANFLDKRDEYTMGALGLSGEAGEVADLIKKHVYHNKPLDRDKLLNEIGDVRWYLEFLLISLDVSMEEIERINTEKLRKRYPFGFTYEAAQQRADEK